MVLLRFRRRRCETPALHRQPRLHAPLRVRTWQEPELVVISCVKPQRHNHRAACHALLIWCRPACMVYTALRALTVACWRAPRQHHQHVQLQSSAQTQGNCCQEQLTFWREVGRRGKMGRRAWRWVLACWWQGWTPALHRPHRLHAHLKSEPLAGTRAGGYSCVNSHLTYLAEQHAFPIRKVATRSHGTNRPTGPHCCITES